MKARRALLCWTAMAVLLIVPLAVSPAQAGPASSCPSTPPTSPTAGPRKGGSFVPAVSADGRFVSFQSWDSNLVAGDTNKSTDVFRYDRVTATLLRVSLDPNGGQIDDGAMAFGGMSGDGNRLLLYSGSPDMAAGTSPSAAQFFVRDVSAALTTLVSATPGGRPTSGYVSGSDAVISADGRTVIFVAQGDDLVVSDAPATTASLEVYARNLDTGTTERVSVHPTGAATPTGSYGPAVSGDGRFVAFTAQAPFTGDNTNGSVYLKDRQTGGYELISIGSDGQAIPGILFGMSDDGQVVLFGAADTDGDGAAVFVRDRAAATTRRLFVLDAAAPQLGYRASLSRDGRTAAIQTGSPTGPDDTNGVDDIVVVDVATGTARRATLSSAGCQPNAATVDPALSASGTIVAFDSDADNLAAGDNNGHSDVFVRDLAAGTTQWVSRTGHTSQD